MVNIYTLRPRGDMYTFCCNSRVFSFILASLMEDIEPGPGVRVSLVVTELALGGRATGGVPGFDIDEVRFTPSVMEARGCAVVDGLGLALESEARREGGFLDRGDFAVAVTGFFGVGASELLRDGGVATAGVVDLGGIEDLAGCCGPDAIFLTGEATDVGLVGRTVAFEAVGFTVTELEVPELGIYLTVQRVARISGMN
jgi:hypothetical protein